MPTRQVSRGKHTGRWRARVKVEGESLDLGVFDTPKEAAERENQFRERHGIRPRVTRAKMHWVTYHSGVGESPALMTRKNIDGTASLTIFFVGDIGYRDNVREYSVKAGDEIEDMYGYWTEGVSAGAPVSG